MHGGRPLCVGKAAAIDIDISTWSDAAVLTLASGRPDHKELTTVYEDN